MKTLVFLLALVAVAGALRAATRRRARARRERIRETAVRLGLTFTGIDALGKPIFSSSRPALPEPRPTAGKPLADLLGTALGASWEVTGPWNGREVRIGPGFGKYRAVLRARFRRTRTLGLFVASASGAAASPPHGTRRLATGDEEFDRRMEVAGRDASGVEAFVRQPDVRQAILRAADADGSTVVDDEGVFVVRYREALEDPDAGRPLLDHVTRLADAVEGALDR